MSAAYSAPRGTHRDDQRHSRSYRSSVRGGRLRTRHEAKFRTLVKTSLLLSVLLPLSGHSIEPDASVRAVEVLRTTSTWFGSPIELPHGPPEIIGVVIEIAPGGETGWHSHPAPSFAFVIAGTLEVRLASGEMKRFRPGEAFAEVIDTQHNGRSMGHDPVKLVVFYATNPGVPVTMRTHEHDSNSRPLGSKLFERLIEMIERSK